jgi:hypothetical protein
VNYLWVYSCVAFWKLLFRGKFDRRAETELLVLRCGSRLRDRLKIFQVKEVKVQDVGCGSKVGGQSSGRTGCS